MSAWSDPPASRRQLDRLLAELLELDADAREARLAGLPLPQQQRLRVLLDAALREDGFLRPGGALEQQLIETALASGAALAAGTLLGPWRVLRLLGAGGMGQVYLAERADHLFERQVALKWLGNLAVPLDNRRLQREQQLLASLVHPNIARLYDAGIASDGTPFLVIEHVDGVCIDVWCRQQALSTRQRIDLLIEVCHAVEAAHRQLVVHRDIKPANIMVAGDGSVKLLDFGIARLANAESEAAPKQACVALDGADSSSWAWLTPRYASPEQRRGEPAGTASDVYQLGLLCWELLAGHPPAVDADGRHSSAMARSLRPAGVHAADLHAVLERALSEPCAARYPTVDRLRDDLERLRAGDPVSARAAGLGDRALRRLRRHPFGSAAVVLISVLMLVTGIGFTLRLAAERAATQLQAERAEQARDEAEQLLGFLRRLFRAADPYQAMLSKPAAQMTASELLDRAAADLAAMGGEAPLRQARLLLEVARLHRMLGEAGAALPLVRRALALSEQDAAPPLLLADARLDLARTLALQGGGAEAVKLAAEAEASYRRAADARRLAGALETRGNLIAAAQPAAARTVMEEALAIYKALDMQDRVAATQLYLANILSSLGQSDAARAQREAALAINLERVGPNHPALADALVGLADQYQREGSPAEAVPLLERAIAIYADHFAADDFRAGIAHNNLGNALSDLGDQHAALPHLQQALRSYRRHAPKSAAVGSILNNLGSVEWRLGHARNASDYYRQGLQQLRPLLADEHIEIALLEANLGEALFDLGEDDQQARVLLERSLGNLRKYLGAQHPMLVPNLRYLATLEERRGALARAEALLREAIGIQEQAGGDDAEGLRDAKRVLDALVERQRR